MTNREKYNFDDFTEENYRHLLEIAQKGYTFIGYSQAGQPGRNLLWRHDIDHSIHRAAALARIEHSLGIRATYFVYTHSPFYNLLEADCAAQVREILSLGHHLGLHADHGFYEQNFGEDCDGEQCALWEKQQLEYLFGHPVSAVSFHQPGYRNSGDIKVNNYAGVPNAYAQSIFDRYQYCSDSNGYWRFRRLEEVLQDESIPALQVLTHPAWWVPSVMSPAQRIRRTIDGNAGYAWQLYCRELRESGRDNIGEEEFS